MIDKGQFKRWHKERFGTEERPYEYDRGDLRAAFGVNPQGLEEELSDYKKCLNYMIKNTGECENNIQHMNYIERKLKKYDKPKKR